MFIIILLIKQFYNKNFIFIFYFKLFNIIKILLLKNFENLFI